jgi:hypothetical protein
MAMMVTLKNRDGMSAIRDIGKHTAYPDVIVSGEKTYVIKQVAQDKKSATYMEADPLKLDGGSDG